jgi:hypothetical protein
MKTAEEIAEEIATRNHLFTEDIDRCDVDKLVEEITVAIEAERKESGLAHREASRLCTVMAKQWANNHPDFDLAKWGLCDTTAGIISQIDNIYAGVRNERDSALQELKEAREETQKAMMDWEAEISAEMIAENIVKEHYARGVVSGLRMIESFLTKKGPQND